MSSIEDIIFGEVGDSRFPKFTCLYCEHTCHHLLRTREKVVDFSTYSPQQGDYLVCHACYEVMIFDTGSKVRKPYIDEQLAVALILNELAVIITSKLVEYYE